ncbi:TlpA family protein disulfide reductase [Beggiatoa alba]|nr:TlpA family protein disulfide reductase [Beggiatoa alba]
MNIQTHLSYLAILFLTSLPFLSLAQDRLPEMPAGLIKLNPYPAPGFLLKDIDNQAYDLSESRQHWVFIHFWASWCGPCRREMPAIQKMWATLEVEGLKIALINTAEDEDTVFNFLGIYAPDIRALMDSDGQVTEQWKPRGLPATFLVDPTGFVRYQALGGRPWDKTIYLNFLRRLLEQK